MNLEIVARTEIEVNKFHDHSLFRITNENGLYIQLKDSDLKETPLSEGSKKISITGLLDIKPEDDFTCSFRFMPVLEHDENNAKFLSDNMRFIEKFKHFTSMNTIYQYDENQLFDLLCDSVKNLTKFCTNDLNATINPSEPYREPNEAIQRVIIYI